MDRNEIKDKILKYGMDNPRKALDPYWQSKEWNIGYDEIIICYGELIKEGFIKRGSSSNSILPDGKAFIKNGGYYRKKKINRINKIKSIILKEKYIWDILKILFGVILGHLIK